MGIPRLKMPQGAPSRATLKLEEAWLVLVGKNLTSILRPGMRAVDLGAAPGGWTWALAQRRIYVIAVDNGALAPLLRRSEFVEYVRADGFRFRPQQQVAWLVCDIVAQPFRIAQLIAQWAREGWCRNALFNLKLPMKKRYAEVTRCLNEIRTSLDSEGIGYSLVCKQLYHDRDEVTCYLSLKDSKKSPRIDSRKSPGRRIESNTKQSLSKGAGSRPRKRRS
jgi:23S rRNA (cytidine2498-2'-O)-methyltransferase